MEIRGAAGGDEAALFAGDLFNMYQKYAENQGWKVEVMDANVTGIGGYKEVIMMITGDNVFSKLKYESGAHRVQRYRLPNHKAESIRLRQRSWLCLKLKKSKSISQTKIFGPIFTMPLVLVVSTSTNNSLANRNRCCDAR